MPKIPIRSRINHGELKAHRESVLLALCWTDRTYWGDESSFIGSMGTLNIRGMEGLGCHRNCWVYLTGMLYDCIEEFRFVSGYLTGTKFPMAAI